MEINLNCPSSSNPNSEVDGLYPAGSVPEDRRQRLSALCSFGQTPRLVTGLIRQILIQHFADPDHIANPYLRNYLRKNGAWQEGEESGIYIESLARWRPEMTELRPALLIKEGDWVWKRVSIGDQAGYDYRSGELFFTGFWQGTHTVFAIGGEGAETQLLSAEAAKLLLYYSPLICDEMGLHRFVMMKLGSLRALKESTENYVAPIDCAYFAEESWKLQQDAPRLKEIKLNVNDLLLG